MGLAVYNSIILDIRFPPCCYKKLLSPAVVPFHNPNATVGIASLGLQDLMETMPVSYKIKTLHRVNFYLVTGSLLSLVEGFCKCDVQDFRLIFASRKFLFNMYGTSIWRHSIEVAISSLFCRILVEAWRNFWNMKVTWKKIFVKHSRLVETLSIRITGSGVT